MRDHNKTEETRQGGEDEAVDSREGFPLFTHCLVRTES